MITVNIGFENNIDFDGKSDIIDTQDETQFDVESLEELATLFSDFCSENGFDPCRILYIETV